MKTQTPTPQSEKPQMTQTNDSTRLYEKPCECDVKVTYHNSVGQTHFCANCLRPTEKEWKEQMYYKQAMEKEL